METTDIKLLELYYRGFEDSLTGHTTDIHFDKEIEEKAYNKGYLDAYFGDELKSIDYQSDEEILKKIKK